MTSEVKVVMSWRILVQIQVWWMCRFMKRREILSKEHDISRKKEILFIILYLRFFPNYFAEKSRKSKYHDISFGYYIERVRI